MEIGRSALHTSNNYSVVEASNEIGNGINSHSKRNHENSANQNISNSFISYTNKTTDIPHRISISVPKVLRVGFSLSNTKFLSTKNISNNPRIYISNSKYDRRINKNPYPIRFLRSIRLNQTKSDNIKETISNSANLKGQTYPLKKGYGFINTTKALGIPYYLHTNKQNQNKFEQRILSTTKIMNKRSILDYDIIDEENKVPNEKQQQHIWHAFNDSNSIGNGTHEKTINSKRLTFISGSNVQSDQSPKNIRQLSIEVSCPHISLYFLPNNF